MTRPCEWKWRRGSWANVRYAVEARPALYISADSLEIQRFRGTRNVPLRSPTSRASSLKRHAHFRSSLSAYFPMLFRTSG